MSLKDKLKELVKKEVALIPGEKEFIKRSETFMASKEKTPESK